MRGAPDLTTASGETVIDIRERVATAAEAALGGVRREAGREVPLGPRGVRTRATLVRAAYRLFEERGYHGTSVADIAAAAGVSLGTFYQYFSDRSDVMAALVGEMVLKAIRRDDNVWDTDGGRLGLRRVVAGFVRTYARTARLQAAWEQVTHLDDGLASLRHDLTRLYVEATEAELRRGQERGLVDPGVDPACAAVALNAMVDRSCYLTFVVRGATDEASVESCIDELTRLWADGIGLVEPAQARRGSA